MISFLIKLYAYISVYIPHYVVGYVIITGLYRAFYLKATGYDKWWLSIIPFGHFFYRRDLSGCPLYLLVPLGVCELFAIAGSALFWFPTWLLNCLCNFQFGAVYLNQGNNVIFSFIPLGKYFVMWKEIRVCQKCNKVKNTSKRI